MLFLHSWVMFLIIMVGGAWLSISALSLVSFRAFFMYVNIYIYKYLSCTMSHECFIATFFMFSDYLGSHCLAIEKVDVELPRKHLPGSITHQHMTAKTQMLGPHCVGDSHLKLPQLGKNTQVFKLKCQLRVPLRQCLHDYKSNLFPRPWELCHDVTSSRISQDSTWSTKQRDPTSKKKNKAIQILYKLCGLTGMTYPNNIPTLTRRFQNT